MEGAVRGHLPWKKRPFAKCGISVAAKVNGDGPYCDRCRKRELRASLKAWRLWEATADQGDSVGTRRQQCAGPFSTISSTPPGPRRRNG